MADSLHLARRDLRNLAFRLQLARYRRAARRLFDGFHFGTGRAERLAAALVVSALSFLLILLVCGLSTMPPAAAIATGAAALVIAWGTSAFFILGEDDEAVEAALATLHEQLAVRKAEFAVLREEAAVAREEERRRREDEMGRSLEEEREQEQEERTRRPTKQRCPYCDEVISIRAVKCRLCGELLDPDLRREREAPRQKRRTFSPVLAGLMSAFVPGLGQLYKGQFGRAVLWFFVVPLSYCLCFVPGPIVYVICICDAAADSDEAATDSLVWVGWAAAGLACVCVLCVAAVLVVPQMRDARDRADTTTIPQADLSEGVRRGVVGVRLVSSGVRKVDVTARGVLFETSGKTAEEYFCVEVELTNHHAGRRLLYQGWGSAAVLYDEHGNVYRRLRHEDHGRVKGQLTNPTALDPGEPVVDLLVFEKPVAVAKTLVLSLPMDRVEGQSGMLRAVVPRDFRRAEAP
jgi:hypothetical protein